MGNRGVLHDANDNVARQWAHKSWVTCLLSFNGIARPKALPKSRYSGLFFLDEATAFSAGHRPCAACQRERHLQFKRAWLQANIPEDGCSSMTISEIDNVLHSERTTRGGDKGTFDAKLSELPLGAMFEHEGLAYLLDARGCLPWSFGGYASPRTIDTATTVKVLTPPSIVHVFANGFAPRVHHSARGPQPNRAAAMN